MYHSPFLWLGDAVTLIARQLAKERPVEFADEAYVLDIARRQIVRALFDGAVCAEGVWLTDPGPDDPSVPPPLPEPDEWRKIEAGWWSHERYTPYVAYPPDPSIQLLLAQENSVEKEVQQRDLSVPQVIEGWDLLDKMGVRWDEHSCDPIGHEGDCAWARIRVRRADIEAQFGVRELEYPLPDTDSSGQIIQIEERTELAAITEPKRTRPPRVKDAVRAWIEKFLHEKGPDLIKDKSTSWLADRYATNESKKLRFFADRAAKKWPLRGSLKLG
jgi:hypothetical protein